MIAEEACTQNKGMRKVTNHLHQSWEGSGFRREDQQYTCRTENVYRGHPCIRGISCVEQVFTKRKQNLLID